MKETEAADRETLEQLAAGPLRKVAARISKSRKLVGNLKGDLDRHGDADRWKRSGDLILANLRNATRQGDSIFVNDYFADGAPLVEIEGDEHKPLAEIAEGYFRRYTKARNGLEMISGRIEEAEKIIAEIEQERLRIRAAIDEGDEDFVRSLIVAKPKPAQIGRKKKVEAAFRGARRFVSSGGFEILVGKKAADNDFLTFRIAKSLDTWLHAADYSGSHVVVRSQNIREIPNQTLIEAAQLAAFYSDARESPKAAVNYTLRKFVNKVKGAKPGLVRLASFKTILVEPQVPAGSRMVLLEAK
jgi:predicted ribosome quality control (RQC) complex YloA/Tae2 family protein